MKIKYFYDPLCGWCYGASAALEKAESLGFKVESYPTGFFSESGGQAMTSNFADYAWANDQRIEKITGQVFSEEYQKHVLSNLAVRFDSWMPTVAVVAHESKFKDEGLKLLRAIQKARYVAGLDCTNPEVLADIAKHHGWDSNDFLALIIDPTFQQQTRIKIAKNLASYEKYHAKGIPLIVIENDGVEQILSSSFVFRKDPNPKDWFKIKK